jgi:hypothetical protein
VPVNAPGTPTCCGGRGEFVDGWDVGRGAVWRRDKTYNYVLSLENEGLSLVCVVLLDLLGGDGATNLDLCLFEERGGEGVGSLSGGGDDRGHIWRWICVV